MTKRNLRIGLLGLVLASSVLAMLTLFSESPDSLFDQAVRLEQSDAKRSQDLLLQSIAAAGGQFPKAQLALARSLLREGRCFEALGSFGSIEHPSQCDPRELFEIADQAHNAKCLLLANLSAEAASTLPGAQQADVFALLTKIRIEQTRFPEALEACKKWSELEPENVNAWLTSGQLHQRLIEPLRAVKAYRTALGLQSSPDEAIRIRGALLPLLLDVGDLADARKQLEAIKEHGSLNETLALSEAELLRLEGNLEEAKRTIEKVVKQCKADCVQAVYVRGLIKFDLGDYVASIRDFENVIAHQPNHKEAHFKLGRALLSTNQIELAQQHLEISRRLTESLINRLNDGLQVETN